MYRRSKLPVKVIIACAVVSITAAALLLSIGCGEENPRQVRGQVVEVVSRNFTELESLRIRDADGREYAFTAAGFLGFTPSHVKEHQLLGQTLLVTYVERGDELVALALTD